MAVSAVSGDRRGLSHLLIAPPARRRTRRSNDGTSVSTEEKSNSTVASSSSAATTTTSAAATPLSFADVEDDLLAVSGRWFALYRLLPHWHATEPFVLELRRVLSFYAKRAPDLALDTFRWAVEDVARVEISIRDIPPVPALVAAHQLLHESASPHSQLGGVARVPCSWADDESVLLARICFDELPVTRELPRTGVLLVMCARRNANGAVHGVTARYVRDERALHRSVETRLTSAKLAFPLRSLSFVTTLSLPPPQHAATPSALRNSAAYAFLCTAWRDARTARGRHSLLGYAQSYDRSRNAARQRECDEAAAWRDEHEGGCGRDVLGVCGRRPLLTLASDVHLPGAIFGAMSACVAWTSGARRTCDSGELRALAEAEEGSVVELKVTNE
jgi:hypothetical protein